jgi:CO/xanthine dehydrogenase FAD-binding subunit
MILEYHRPNSIEEALQLLDREMPPTVPLGGGNLLSRRTDENIAVVDLQKLKLKSIQSMGQIIEIGASVTLEEFYRHQEIHETLRKAVYLDATANTRNTATIGGLIAGGTGNSALLCALLALDTRLEWLPGEITQSLGDYISVKGKINSGKLITKIQISSQVDVKMASVGRSPLDPPFIIVVVSQWPSGRTRLVLGGKVKSPILAMDGTTQDGIVDAGVNACSQLLNKWISLDYLKYTTSKLIQRLSEA